MQVIYYFFHDTLKPNLYAVSKEVTFQTFFLCFGLTLDPQPFLYNFPLTGVIRESREILSNVGHRQPLLTRFSK